MNLRRTARSRHQAKPGVASGCGYKATVDFSRCRTHGKLSYFENKGLLPGVFCKTGKNARKAAFMSKICGFACVSFISAKKITHRPPEFVKFPMPAVRH